MTEQQHDETQGSQAADETFAWSAEQETGTPANTQAREWISQLQAMIENLATQARPVIRDVGIKAAELAAIAGEKAGPVAQRAAEMAGQAGQKLAERSRDLAADLRSQQAAPKDGSEMDAGTTGEAGTAEGAEDKPTAGVA